MNQALLGKWLWTLGDGYKAYGSKLLWLNMGEKEMGGSTYKEDMKKPT